MFHDTCVANAQKLVGASHHVDVEMFLLGAFLVHEKEDRLVCRCVLQNYSHDLKQSLAQDSRAAFRDRAGLRIEIAGLKRRGVNACKADESFYIGEPRHLLKDLSNVLV